MIDIDDDINLDDIWLIFGWNWWYFGDIWVIFGWYLGEIDDIIDDIIDDDINLDDILGWNWWYLVDIWVKLMI